MPKIAYFLVIVLFAMMANYSNLSHGSQPAGSADDDWTPLKASAKKRPSLNMAGFNKYQKAVLQTKQMVYNRNAQKLARKYGLNVLNITWEDTGRYKGSSVGPNISDMTIQVALENPKTQRFSVHSMPVIRYPNFSDTTTDLNPRDFTLLVGNHDGSKLKRISLYEFLSHPRDYLSNPDSWKGDRMSLLAPRDKKVLVSAQACFLPVLKKGKATFNPVLFNYQSVKNDPAVLTILATRQGTSVTIIDNTRDAFSQGGVWGQRLFHNKNGERTSLTAQRFSDYKPVNGSSKYTSKNKPKVGLSMVLLIQVPLKQKRPRRNKSDYFGGNMLNDAEGAPPSKSFTEKRLARSDVEVAVIGHGKAEGPFTEIDDIAIERDSRYPIRVTVQFYKATSNGIVNNRNLAQVKKDINSVYSQGDVVGSLVVGGSTGRITEYQGSKVQPADWWENFWKRYEENTGRSRIVAMRKLRRLLGRNYRYRKVTELYCRDLLRNR